MKYMFFAANDFNQPLDFNTSYVVDMRHMFNRS